MWYIHEQVPFLFPNLITIAAFFLLFWPSKRVRLDGENLTDRKRLVVSFAILTAAGLMLADYGWRSPSSTNAATLQDVLHDCGIYTFKYLSSVILLNFFFSAAVTMMSARVEGKSYGFTTFFTAWMMFSMCINILYSFRDGFHLTQGLVIMIIALVVFILGLHGHRAASFSQASEPPRPSSGYPSRWAYLRPNVVTVGLFLGLYGVSSYVSLGSAHVGIALSLGILCFIFGAASLTDYGSRTPFIQADNLREALGHSGLHTIRYLSSVILLNFFFSAGVALFKSQGYGIAEPFCVWLVITVLTGILMGYKTLRFTRGFAVMIIALGVFAVGFKVHADALMATF